MLIYHRTPFADEILSNGFLDGTSKLIPGVWFSELPLDDSEDGARGPTVLAVDIPELEILPYEQNNSIGCRVFCIPANVLNLKVKPTVHVDDRGCWSARDFELCRIACAGGKTKWHRQDEEWEVNVVAPDSSTYTERGTDLADCIHRLAVKMGVGLQAV